MKQAGRRRGFKSWFVEPYKQVKLGLMFLIVNLLFSALIFGIFGYYALDMYTAVTSYFHLTEEQSGLALNKFSIPLIAGGGLIALFVITTILISVKYTHEIYGPLVSIHRFLDQFLEGRRPEPLQLRESDQLKDLATKLNTLAETKSADQRQQGNLTPIYRFLDELIEGEVPQQLKMRDSDQFSVLLEKLNKLSQSLASSRKG